MNNKRRSKVYREEVKKQKIESALETYNEILSLEKSRKLQTEAEESIDEYEISYGSEKSNEFEESCSAEKTDNILSHNSNILTEKEYDLETEHDLEITDKAEIDEIKEWVVANKIPHVHVNKLLHILRRRVLPDLPSTCNTLLKNNINFKIESMEACDNTLGEFTYFKIKPHLQTMINVK